MHGNLSNLYQASIILLSQSTSSSQYLQSIPSSPLPIPSPLKLGQMLPQPISIMSRLRNHNALLPPRRNRALNKVEYEGNAYYPLQCSSRLTLHSSEYRDHLNMGQLISKTCHYVQAKLGIFTESTLQIPKTSSSDRSTA
jgi:hypothetical protein